MNLSRNHRRSLLSALKEALAKKENIKHMFTTEAFKNDLACAESLEIDDFLNEQHILAIEAALVDEEIDY